jgi:hypothetical protein
MNNTYGAIIAVGIVGILLIVIGSAFGLPANLSRGCILIGISLLLFLVAGATFGLHWVVGGVVGVVGIVVFLFGMHYVLTPPPSNQTSLLSLINQLQLF